MNIIKRENVWELWYSLSVCQAHWCVTCPSQWGLPALLCPSFVFLPVMLSTSSLSSHIALFRLPSLLCGCLTLPSLLFSFPPSHINTSHFLWIFTPTKGDKKCFYIKKKKRNSVQLILHGIKLLLWSRQPYSVGVFITASGQSLVIVTQLH